MRSLSIYIVAQMTFTLGTKANKINYLFISLVQSNANLYDKADDNCNREDGVLRNIWVQISNQMREDNYDQFIGM